MRVLSFFKEAHRSHQNILPRKLTWNPKINHFEGKSCSKPPFWGSMLVFRGVSQPHKHPYVKDSIGWIFHEEFRLESWRVFHVIFHPTGVMKNGTQFWGDHS